MLGEDLAQEARPRAVRGSGLRTTCQVRLRSRGLRARARSERRAHRGRDSPGTASSASNRTTNRRAAGARSRRSSSGALRPPIRRRATPVPGCSSRGPWALPCSGTRRIQSTTRVPDVPTARAWADRGSERERTDPGGRATRSGTHALRGGPLWHAAAGVRPRTATAGRAPRELRLDCRDHRDAGASADRGGGIGRALRSSGADDPCAARRAKGCDPRLPGRGAWRGDCAMDRGGRAECTGRGKGRGRANSRLCQGGDR